MFLKTSVQGWGDDKLMIRTCNLSIQSPLGHVHHLQIRLFRLNLACIKLSQESTFTYTATFSVLWYNSLIHRNIFCCLVHRLTLQHSLFSCTLAYTTAFSVLLHTSLQHSILFSCTLAYTTTFSVLLHTSLQHSILCSLAH